MLVDPIVITILDILITPILLLKLSLNHSKQVTKYGLCISFLLYFIFIPIIILCNDYFSLQTTPILICLFIQLFFLTNKEERSVHLINNTLTIIYTFEIYRYFLNSPFYLLRADKWYRSLFVIFITYCSEYLGTKLTITYLKKQFPIFEEVMLNNISYTRFISFSLFLQEFFFYIQQVNNKYDEMLIYSFLFMITTVFYFYLLLKTQYSYIDNLLNKEKIEQEVLSLKKYSSLINEKQNQLRKFRHDYKNLILTLTSLAHENKIEEMKTYLQELNVYSQEQLELAHLPFNDLNIIQNSIIRGFIFSKLLEFEMNHHEIEFQSESNLAEINLDNFNLIRILGIYFDNALEHLSDHQEGKFTLRILENDAAHFFTIKNSYYGDKLLIREIIQQGFTTKEGHSGQGLDTIEVIKQKYPQLSVRYEQGEFFQVQLIIEKNKE